MILDAAVASSMYATFTDAESARGGFLAMVGRRRIPLALMHTDSVVSFESFRALKLSKSESFRALIFSQHFFNFRALKLSNFESFRALNFSKLVSFRALKSSKVESFRALKFYHPKTLKKGEF